MDRFVIHSAYAPTGDQPAAIEKLTEGVRDGLRTQVLLGVTGSGKTFTMANVIAAVGRPTLVLAHNKTLAAQLYSEFKELFPENAVEYFVSYYDYYRPEAYIAASDTYVEKEADTNEEIDRLRFSALASLQERRDVIVVASVSCIYGLGDPKSYTRQAVSLRPGYALGTRALAKKLVSIQYERNDVDFSRGTFRVHGDVFDLWPVHLRKTAIRIEFFGDEIDSIAEFDPVTGRVLNTLDHVMVLPATMYATDIGSLTDTLARIERDAAEQQKLFEERGKLIEAQRIGERTRYDLEMMRELGYCQGIENYSRYFDGRSPGEPPYTLLDYFPKDFLLIVDESHVSLPQVRGMSHGDLARKTALVEYGFRLPSAYDNRPLTFEEFLGRVNQMICVSATPGDFELAEADEVVEQLIRPTGLLDPKILVRPVTGQVDDVVGELNAVIAAGWRAMVVTLTKRMAEDLTEYLGSLGIRARYMHSEIHTLERTEILRDLRLGRFDVLVGINLMREGLDLPEVALVAILDADKEGFLRNTRSLIQTIGRAARNAEGRVILYGDTVTDSMRAAIDETERRRAVQQAYNESHGVVPRTIVKAVADTIAVTHAVDARETEKLASEAERAQRIELLRDQMLVAAEALDFEKAASLRDEILTLQGKPVRSVSVRRRHRR